MGFVSEVPVTGHLESTLPPVDHSADAPASVTRAALADMIATAIAAAGVAQQRTGATTATVRAAALSAIEDTAS